MATAELETDQRTDEVPPATYGAIRRGVMNLVMIAGTAYWFIVLYQVVFSGYEVVSADWRYVGYSLLFVGAVVVLTTLFTLDDEGAPKYSVGEGVYYVLNCIFFVVVLCVGALP